MFLCETELDARHIEAAFIDAGIGHRFRYGGGLHKHSYFKELGRVPAPVSEDICPRAIGLPMAPELEMADFRLIRGTVLRAVPENRE